MSFYSSLANGSAIEPTSFQFESSTTILTLLFGDFSPLFHLTILRKNRIGQVKSCDVDTESLSMEECYQNIINLLIDLDILTKRKKLFSF